MIHFQFELASTVDFPDHKQFYEMVTETLSISPKRLPIFLEVLSDTTVYIVAVTNLKHLAFASKRRRFDGTTTIILQLKSRQLDAEQRLMLIGTHTAHKTFLDFFVLARSSRHKEK